jgi:threonine synthase
MPVRIPLLTRHELESLRSSTLAETGALIAGKLFGEDVPAAALHEITQGALNFETPLVKVSEGIHSLELFHGPTLAFKDVGARFMARMLGYFARNSSEELHVLVATSGDTGSAVANGFLGVEGIRVHVLYPSGQVSALQEKQFTTLGGNVTALEVSGSFDDCQALVKSAFADEPLRNMMAITSANSINLARFLPQSFYYFNAWGQQEEWEVVFSVPSGNYGNLTAGLVAREMGLPIERFLAASNANDVVPAYLSSGTYRPRPSVPTIANAMDVGAPSNFERILDLFNHRHDRITRHLTGYAFSDQQIREVITRVYRETGYVLDTHGATGYEAARSYRTTHPGSPVIFLETAHPAKFGEEVENAIGTAVDVPTRLADFAKRKKMSVPIGKDYNEFREYLEGIR